MYEGTLNGQSIGMYSVGQYQPKGQWLWIVEVHPPVGANVDGRIYTAMAESSQRPELGVETFDVTHLNEYAGFAGKPIRPPNFSITLVDGYDDSVIPANVRTLDTAEMVYNWYQAIYNPYLGDGGYGVEYKGSLLVQLLDPQLNAIETWTGKGCFPKGITLGDLNYTSGANYCTVSTTWNIDKWFFGNTLARESGFTGNPLADQYQGYGSTL
jgi:hypothetical protein